MISPLSLQARLLLVTAGAYLGGYGNTTGMSLRMGDATPVAKSYLEDYDGDNLVDYDDHKLQDY